MPVDDSDRMVRSVAGYEDAVDPSVEGEGLLIPGLEDRLQIIHVVKGAVFLDQSDGVEDVILRRDE